MTPTPSPPDDHATSSMSIKSGIVATLVGRAMELGVDSTPWFTGLRVGRADFGDPRAAPYLSYREACTVIARALPTLPGNGHGLELGGRQTLAEFGLIGLAMMTSATFGDALRTAIRFSAISGALLDVSLEDVPEGAAVLIRMHTEEPTIEAYLCEELIASCHNLCRGLLGERFHAERVELAYPAPPHGERYAIAFAAPVQFGCRQSRVIIARHWLETPMPAANPDTARQIAALCRAQMPSEQPPAGLVSEVQRQLALQVGQTPRLTDVAAELHLTERTLRRQLGAAGTSFRALLDQARERAALELLQDQRLTVAQVAGAVGFGDVRDFRRAFKRWTGRVPRESRREPPASA